VRHLKLASGCALVLSLSACATITRGTKQKFAIVSNPPGATAKLSTGQSCTTPCQLKLPRDIGFKVTLSRDGYARSVSEVKADGYSNAIIGNVIAGGLVGVLVDTNNGSLMSLSPNPLRVEMIASAASPQGPALAAAPIAPQPAAGGASTAGPTPANATVAAKPLAAATTSGLTAVAARQATDLYTATGQSGRIYEVLEGPYGSVVSVSVVYDGRAFEVPGATISAGETASRLKTSLTAKQVGKLRSRAASHTL
jgi:hypothetical protein